MDIVFFRHGKAERRTEGIPDTERRLLPEGRLKTNKAAEKLKKRVLRSPVTILTSPAMRALQTALIIKEVLLPDEFIVLDGLYAGDASALKAEIDALDKQGTCVIVGHNPFLSDLLSRMLSLRCHIKKSGYVIVRRTDEGGNHVTEVRRALILPR